MKSIFEQTMSQLEQDPQILRMRQYSQHTITTTFNHSRRVALYSYHLAKKFGWKIDEKSLAIGAMLHDFYLYDIEERKLLAWDHGVHHSKIALKNAGRHFQLNEVEKDIILTHMWPLTITHMPHSREAVLVCMADKICASKEMFLKM